MSYLFLKSIHIIGFISWMAGLFYLVRIFVYHAEAFEKEAVAKQILTVQFHLMEKRVFAIICNPGLVITWVCGLLLLYVNGYEWFRHNLWMHFKLLFLIFLTVYHFYCGKIIKRLQNNEKVMSDFGFRLLNEVPTVLMLVIVFLAVYKNLTDAFLLFGGTLVFVFVLFFAARWYKSYRQQTNS